MLEPHKKFDLLAKVNELNRRVRDLELHDPNAGATGSTYTPPYCIAVGNFGWAYNDGYIAPRLHRITDQSGGFSPIFHMADDYLDTPDGISTFCAIQVPEDGLYRASIRVNGLTVQSSVDTPHLWYTPTWYPPEIEEADDAGDYVPPPTGPDDWSRWWAACLCTGGGDRGHTVLLDHIGSVGGVHSYSASSTSGAVLVWNFIFGVGPDWGTWWEGDNGPHNIVGILCRFTQKLDFSGTTVSLSRDLGNPSGAGGSGSANSGATWLTVEKIGDHTDGTAISI